MPERYEVRLSRSAARVFEGLPQGTRTRIRRALVDLAPTISSGARVRGKKVKSIRGISDSFHRLRAGDFRVMHDLVEEDRVVLVLEIVHRGDLERWLRSR